VDIRESGKLLLSLINDILDLSRLDAGQLLLKEDDVDIGELVREAVRMLRLQAQEAGVKVTEHVQATLPSILGDRRRILQVLLNLLANAIKFTPSDGSIRVTASGSGSAVTVTVADTGIGMAELDIPKAFERFGQIDSSLSRKYQGAGLGLPLAKRLVELHGGSLTLESALDRGTTVTIVFPADRIAAHNRAVA
jgi:signal transduction histidine kinase